MNSTNFKTKIKKTRIDSLHSIFIGSNSFHRSDIIFKNKKVLLRECKRHTARRVVSTPSVVLPPRGGTRTPPGGVPGQVPPLGGYPDPPGGVPSQVPPRGVPGPPGGVPGQGPPRGVPGQVPPPGGVPRPPPGGYLDPPPAAPWHSGKCCKALWDMGTPPGVDRQTKVKLLPSRRTTYAGR